MYKSMTLILFSTLLLISCNKAELTSCWVGTFPSSNAKGQLCIKDNGYIYSTVKYPKSTVTIYGLLKYMRLGDSLFVTETIQTDSLFKGRNIDSLINASKWEHLPYQLIKGEPDTLVLMPGKETEEKWIREK